MHTDLGRAPLSTAAREAVRAAAGCADVEFDLATGKRGRFRQPGRCMWSTTTPRRWRSPLRPQPTTASRAE
jgi:hypothetical protein